MFGSLNQQVVLQQVLPDVNVQKLPCSCTCPLCHGEMTLLPDYLCGIWLHCRKCEWAGSSVALVAEVSGLTMTQSIKQAEELGCVITPKDVDDHRRMVEILDWAREMRESGKVQGRGYEADPLVLTLQGDLGRYLSWSSVVPWHLGMTTAEFKRHSAAAPDGVEKEGTMTKGPAVLLDFYTDLPGRPVLINAIGDVKCCSLRIAYEDGGRVDGGLAMLDTVTLDAQAVLAMKDMRLALCWQKYWMPSRPVEGPLPIVVWNDRTVTTWQNLYAPRTVLVASKLDIALLKTAMLAPNGYVSTLEDREKENALLDLPATEYAAVMAAAVPWPMAMKRWLLSDPRETRNRLGMLSLPAAGKALLLDACTVDEKARLDRVTSGSPASFEVRTSHGPILESESGYSYIDPKGRRASVSNVRMFIENLIHYGDTGEVEAKGRIMTASGELPFAVAYSTLTGDAYEWLCHTVLSAGWSYPFVDAKWRRRWLDVVMQLHPPGTLLRNRAAGWSETTKEYVFPSFRTKASEGLIAVPDADQAAPGGALISNQMPTTAEWDVGTLETPLSTEVWAALAVVLCDILASGGRWARTPIGVRLPPSRALPAAFGLVTAAFPLPAAGATYTDTAKLPSVGVDAKAPSGFQLLGELQARCLEFTVPCLYLTADRDVSFDALLGLVRKCVPHFLQWTQAQTLVARERAEPTDVVLSWLAQWLTTVAGSHARHAHDIVLSARKRIATPPRTAAAQAARWLQLFAYVAGEGNTALVTAVDADKRVTLHVPALLRSLADASGQHMEKGAALSVILEAGLGELTAPGKLAVAEATWIEARDANRNRRQTPPAAAG